MNELTDLPNELLDCKTDFEETTEIIVVNANEIESAMTEQAVFCLLDEIIKKKKDLHDPRHRCNRFYGEIREILIAKHGLYFSVRTLERKYHYLKRHFDTMCQNNNSGIAGSKAGTWPYFDKMMEIFAEELEIEDAPTMASLYPDLPLPKSALPQTQSVKEENVDSLPPKVKKLQKNAAQEEIEQEEETEQSEQSEQEDKETTWTHSVVLDFLNECVRKKAEFWDPEHPRRDILKDIQQKMKEKGYRFKIETLDRKLKNFKTCYHGSVQLTRQKSMNAKPGVSRWPYFPQLHELYSGYIEHKVARKKTGRKGPRRHDINPRRPRSRYLRSPAKLNTNWDPTHCEELPSSSMKFRPIRCKPDPIEQYHIPAPDVFQPNLEIKQQLDDSFDDEDDEAHRKDSYSPGDFDCLMEVDETRTDEEFEAEADNSTKTINDEIIDDSEFTSRMLALEERRTIAMEQLLEQLQHSNSIRQRKVEFNRSKLAYLKARAKRREFF